MTSRFAYGPVPAADGYVRRELFYRAALGAPGSRVRTVSKLVEHVPDMLRYRRHAREADVVHVQWLAIQHLDGHLLPGRRTASGRRRTLVITAHDILPREPRPGQRAAQRRLYERFDAIVVHSEHGRERLTGELGIDPARVHVIAHGVLVPPPIAPSAPGSSRLPPWQTDRPVVLFLGLIRPYKGLDVLLDAWRGIDDAELWVVGLPKYNISALRDSAPANVRWLARFVSEDEIDALLRRANLVVLPYREADQSGIALTALGAGVPLLASDVGGLPELAATGAARTFPAGEVIALRTALRELLSDPAGLAAMAERARAAADGPYAWDAIARQTLDLYESVMASR